MNDYTYFRLFANCILVKGALRSSICDIQRGLITLIPNDLHDLLTQNKNKSIEGIKEQYNLANQEIIEGYFNFLLEKELIFLCSKQDLKLFPDLNLAYDNPAQITNAILDFGIETHYDYLATFLQLENLGCKNLQMRFFSAVKMDKLFTILDCLENTRILSIELYIKYYQNITEETYLDLVKKYFRITKLTIHSSVQNKNLLSDFCNIFFTTEVILDSNHCGFISPNNFTANLPTFTEAQHHNTCLNRKISIDTNGEIKNCPSLPQSFGNIANTSLHEALLHKNFKDLWLINKDQIKVCQDCEFRYICTDCRAFITNPTDKFSKPSKCGYNPYTAEWE